MKHLGKVLILSIFILSFSYTAAQDRNNPWALSIGANAVDFYPVGAPPPQGALFEQFFHAEDHWNIPYAFDKLSVIRYIGAGLSGKIDGSINKIKKYGAERFDQSKRYYSLNGGINYSLGQLIHKDNDGWFDPYLGAGLGATWIQEKAAFTGNVELGFNLWASDKIGVEIGTVYRGSLNHNNSDYSHFQHLIGVKFAFGGKDSDGDGVYDAYDDCPNEPGLKEFNGCPDTDGDGIPDKDDECPNDAGIPQFNGCPDFDGDGVPDKEDECPEEPGLKEFKGCPDTDGDGIPDKEDDCPNKAGPQKNNGCPWADKDGDGVPDHQDKCPEIPGSKVNQGCPELPTQKVINQLNEYSKSITFALGKATINKNSEKILKAIAEEMKKYPNVHFHLSGYTDNTGSPSINLKLSKQRATATLTYLIKEEGVHADRLSAKGQGASNPIASNKTQEGRHKNRRVEIEVIKNQSDK